jgi:hypothetical protein
MVSNAIATRQLRTLKLELINEQIVESKIIIEPGQLILVDTSELIAIVEGQHFDIEWGAFRLLN